MSSDVVINAENIGKCYQVYEKPSDRLLQMVFRNKKYFRDFWAIRNISFQVKRGETVGIIGRNGAGKSTLLQMICGTLAQTEGVFQVNGKIAALLELGAGFNPEFTGIENIYMAASLYGVTRDIASDRLQSIIDFAEIGEHVYQPVKTYSSGMFVRLAFSVITHVDANVLIIDEALSVGDVFFQQKCMRFLRQFQEGGGTLLFVSHDMAAVNALCSKCLILKREDNGYKSRYGDADDIVREYLHDYYNKRETLFDSSLANRAVEEEGRAVLVEHGLVDHKAVEAIYRSENINPAIFKVSSFIGGEAEFGAGGARIIDVWFEDEKKERVSEWRSEQSVRLAVSAIAKKPIAYPAIGFMLKSRTGQIIFAESTDSYLRECNINVAAEQQFKAVFEIKLPRMLRGQYVFDIALAEGPGDDHVQHHWIHEALALTVLEDYLVQGFFSTNKFSVNFELIKAGMPE